MMGSSRLSCAALVRSHVTNNPWVCISTFGSASCHGSASNCNQRFRQLPRCQATEQKATAALHQHAELVPSSAKQYPRFYAPALPRSVGTAIELEPEEARHAVKVLRLQQGDPLELCDGHGRLVQCEMAFADKHTATVIATAAPVTVPWQGAKWVVAAACLTLKGGRTDWLIEKATELGAYALLPLVTERSQTGTTKSKFKSLTAKGNKPTDAAADEGFQSGRLQRLALAATKQSLREHALQIQPVTQLSELLPRLQQSPISIVATAGAAPVLQVLQQAQQQQRQQGLHQQWEPCSNADGGLWQGEPCYLLIGPEGDFTPAEVQALASAGVKAVGLGHNRLRTETAAMALLSAAVLFSDAACVLSE